MSRLATHDQSELSFERKASTFCWLTIGMLYWIRVSIEVHPFGCRRVTRVERATRRRRVKWFRGCRPIDKRASI